MSIELKIKFNSLQAEAYIIRNEERKLRKRIEKKKLRTDQPVAEFGELSTFNSIKLHRKWNVRNEQRATHLARAFLKGKPYKEVEKSVKDEHFFKYHIYPRVLSMVGKYGPDKLNKWGQRDEWRKSPKWVETEESLKKWLTSE
jgi:hypothetical protein